MFKRSSKASKSKSKKYQPKKLAELIRDIRNCKTIAEQRAIVNKEKADIRQSFTENRQEYRPRNIAKLLFINLLGYETDFGQMECLNLISRESFIEKRIGYLGITQLFSEKSDILMMATHRLRLDIESSNHYIQAVALQTVSCIANADMCKDLGETVAKLIGKGHSYISKKACLCGLRIVKKHPDLIDMYSERLIRVLGEKNHGLLLSAIALAERIMKQEPSKRKEFAKFVPHIVKRYKSIQMGYSDEYLINEVNDPFLQIAFLKFFRNVLEGETEVDQELQTLLETLPVDTKIKKNTGNAVLYECAITILQLNVNAPVKEAAMEIINRMLGYNNINSTYVSLHLLGHMAKELKTTNFEHLEIVLDSLRSNDLSIKTLALQVLEVLANGSNVQIIVKELLNYMVECEDEMITQVTERVCSIIEIHSPNRRWQVDQITRVLSLAGKYISDDSINTFLQLVAATEPLQAYSIVKTFTALRENMNQDALARVTFWLIGEFADMIRNNQANLDLNEVFSKMRVLIGEQCDSSIKCYILNCLVKLYAKVESVEGQIVELIKILMTDNHEEIQQRAFEYLNIINLRELTFDQKREIMAAMPISQVSANIFNSKPINEGGEIPQLEISPQKQDGGAAVADTNTGGAFEEEGGLLGAFTDTPVLGGDTQNQNTGNTNGDLLNEFGGGLLGETQPTTTPKQDTGGLLGDNNEGLLGLGGGGGVVNNAGTADNGGGLLGMDLTGGTTDLGGGLLGLDGGLERSNSTPGQPAPAVNNGGGLMDLGLGLGGPTTNTTTPQLNATASMDLTGGQTQQGGGGGLLGLDPFSGLTNINTPPATVTSTPQPSQSAGFGLLGMTDLTGGAGANNNDNNDDDFEFADFGSTTPSQQSQTQQFVAFQDENLQINFNCTKTGNKVAVKAAFANKTGFIIDNVNIQIAAAKHLTMTFQPLNTTQMSPGSTTEMTQDITIVNNMDGQKAIALKIRLGYNLNGNPSTKDFVVKNFPF